MNDLKKNKKGRFKPNHINLFGTTFCLPKGVRSEINKLNPELKGKTPLDIKDLPKVKAIISKKRMN